FIGLLLASLACGAAMTFRSHRHHSPVIELGLLRSRTFSGAFAASILYYAAFGAFVLNSVEFLTGVWHYSAVRAGLAIGPGPLMVLPFARLVAPRLAARIGGGRPGGGRGRPGRAARRPAAGGAHRRGRPGGGTRLPGQRGVSAAVAQPDAGAPGLPDAPAP